MTTQECIDYFGGIKHLADALKTWPQTVYQWGSRPPRGRQFEIEVMTEGKLKADRD